MGTSLIQQLDSSVPEMVLRTRDIVPLGSTGHLAERGAICAISLVQILFLKKTVNFEFYQLSDLIC
jgi:hypothetical protein